MAGPHLWLRDEVKPMEHRSALTPTTAKKLIDAGFQITVEKSKPDVRIFEDSEFEAIEGVKMAESGSWVDAPEDAFIIGLKELPEDTFPLKHRHIQFAHCFKRQGGWKDVLKRFPEGKGTLYDLEFLEDDSGRRVAAFGYHAGYAGAALAVEVWAHQILHPNEAFPGVSHYDNEQLLNDHVREVMERASKQSGNNLPQILVIGALGRCGSGAVALARNIGLPENKILKWDMAETKAGGPFKEIIESEIFVNCIYLKDAIAPFVDLDGLNSEGRRLRVVCDVSCDTTNPNNPIPIYSEYSYFSNPTVPVKGVTNGPEVSVIAIDHLPSLLPREASESFSGLLLPSLMQLKKVDEEPVWTRAKALFDHWVAQL
ncbi:saccharopine dehydrogenase [Protomyces lactucae-debilis]|uniref:Saccharopine dehydrogenase [NAD(+), L-lysine-forming] n=1 Tax=Protomyces lactucae-debilis TaxID=2754530 RepID=A0A1Y2EZL8_PROLT|nr:saccharopine dehydrogenase [Protomyces lactucae-debilis]ORY77023.1 saccharopine dehydrogenase [Protomyces lactucae-debilis]